MPVLFSSVGAYGHFHPLVPLARALADREQQFVEHRVGLRALPIAERRPYAYRWRDPRVRLMAPR
jgi:hypothetical protein